MFDRKGPFVSSEKYLLPSLSEADKTKYSDKNLSDHSNLSWMFDNFFWRLSNDRAHHGLPITRIVLKKILAVSQQTQMKLQELSPPLWRGRVYEFA